MAASAGETTHPHTALAAERRALWRMVAPMVPSELIGVITPAAVLVLMGIMGGDALYVRSLFTPLAFLFFALQAGIGVSAQVAAAVAHGGGQPGAVAAGVASIARVGFPCVALVGLVAALCAQPLATLLSVEPAVRADFVAFVRWVSAAMVLLPGPALCVAALRGTGHPWLGGLVLVTTALFEIGLVYLLGLRWGLGSLSVPAAAAVGGVAGTVLGLILARRRSVWPAGAALTWRPEVTGLLVRIGLPVAMSFVLVFASNLGMLWVLSTFGPFVVSGFAAAITLQSVLVVPAVALGSGVAILMNQHLGAGQPQRLRALLRAGLELGAGGYALTALVCWSARDPLALVLTGDPAVAHETSRYLAVVSPTYALFGLVLLALTVLEQIGHGPLALVLNVVYFAGVVAVGGWLARRGSSPSALYDAVAVANLGGVTVVATLVALVRRMSRAGAAPAVAAITAP
ncbi:MATE family efflux transporter [Micromonospora sp. CPCC 205539]|uniref:MATE family efflux transporter n=1 Tax=Micromonospora sp. CPCC 205539 TaxID=3122408 RepID=UPI002FEFE702